VNTLNVQELLTIAVDIEVNGNRFYTQVASKLSDPAIRDLFTHFAIEEIRHRDHFTAMREAVRGYQPQTTQPEEYDAYVRAYADNLVFQLSRTDDVIRTTDTPRVALQLALGMEKDSIVLYYELKHLVPAAERHVVDAVIAEEKRHYVLIHEMLRAVR